jgi:hypothetical protein
MHNFFSSKIYEIPRTGAAREPCVDFAAAKNTVRLYTSTACKAVHSCSTAAVSEYVYHDTYMRAPPLGLRPCTLKFSTVSLRPSGQKLDKLESTFGPKTRGRIKMFYTT